MDSIDDLLHAIRSEVTADQDQLQDELRARYDKEKVMQIFNEYHDKIFEYERQLAKEAYDGLPEDARDPQGYGAPWEFICTQYKHYDPKTYFSNARTAQKKALQLIRQTYLTLQTS